MLAELKISYNCRFTTAMGLLKALFSSSVPERRNDCTTRIERVSPVARCFLPNDFIAVFCLVCIDDCVFTSFVLSIVLKVA